MPQKAIAPHYPWPGMVSTNWNPNGDVDQAVPEHELTEDQLVLLQMFEMYMANYIPNAEPDPVLQKLIIDKDAERDPGSKRFRKKG